VDKPEQKDGEYLIENINLETNNKTHLKRTYRVERVEKKKSPLLRDRLLPNIKQ